jgi:hypothetical protein
MRERALASPVCEVGSLHGLQDVGLPALEQRPNVIAGEDTNRLFSSH